MGRCNCGRHANWGECIRAKNIGISYCRSHVDKNPARHDRSANRRHENELAAYAAARQEGIRPGGTTRAAVDYALKRSDDAGKAWDAANPLGG